MVDRKFPAVNEWCAYIDVPLDFKYYFALHKLDDSFRSYENATTPDANMVAKSDFLNSLRYIIKNGPAETGYFIQAIEKGIVLYLGISTREMDSFKLEMYTISMNTEGNNNAIDSSNMH